MKSAVLVLFFVVLSEAFSVRRTTCASQDLSSRKQQGSDHIVSSRTVDQQADVPVKRKNTLTGNALDSKRSTVTAFYTTEMIIRFPDDSANFVTPRTRKHKEDFQDDPNRNIFQAPKKQCPPGNKVADKGECRPIA